MILRYLGTESFTNEQMKSVILQNKYGKGSSESVSDDPELIVNNTIHIVIIYFPDTVSPICKQFGLSLCFPL